MEKYDLVIIGGGGAGFAAATVGSEQGARVAMINAGLPLGGTCVNIGCVPSKALLEIGKEYYKTQHPHFQAIKSGNVPSFDFDAAIQEKDEIVSALRESNYTLVAQNLGITLIQGRARFVSHNQIQVNKKRLVSEKFIIATGSRPRILPFKGIDKVSYITNREALSLSHLPKSMIVVGGGPLGLEFAQMYSRFGTRVTVLEKQDQILPAAESVVAEDLQRCLEEEGIEIHTNVNINNISEERELKVVTAKVGKRDITTKGEELLLATGVVPNSDDMGLDAAGVDVDSRGFIKVNKELRTSSSHIWAAGDVVGKAFLETVAAKEGHIAASNALQETKRAIDYKSVPSAVFTDPQVASVGYTEDEYMERFNVCACRTVEMARVPKARVIKETHGLIKMAIHPETRVIVGVHIVAPMAADLIHEAVLAVKFKLTIEDIINTVHVFPTMSEAIKLVAHSFTRDISKMSCCVE